MLAEETVAFATGTSLLGFKRLPMDQENIQFLYQEETCDEHDAVSLFETWLIYINVI